MALIEAFYAELELVTAKELRDFLDAVHRSFAVQTKSYLAKAVDTHTTNIRVTFKALKRLKIDVDYSNRKIKRLSHQLSTNTSENFTEVVNQMATIEGMLFALDHWQENYLVHTAHPTQSFGDENLTYLRDYDHDLILASTKNKHLRFIEVSDVVSDKDSNRKFSRDLKRLYRSYKTASKEKAHKFHYSFYIVTSSEVWEGISRDNSPTIFKTYKLDGKNFECRLTCKSHNPELKVSMIKIDFNP